MKILKLEAENIKRLVAVEITPDSNMVQIAGKNGNGKTSVLDAIKWAIEGAPDINTVPIRLGEDEARIRLDLGEIVVRRTFKKKDPKFTTTLVVESAEGARFSSPQDMMNKLLGSISLDPIEFLRLKPAEQFETLRKFVPGFDFDAADKANETDYTKRTEVNRDAEKAKAAAGSIIIAPGTPAEPVDDEALLAQMSKAAEHNTMIEQKRARRAQGRIDVERGKASAKALIQRANSMRAEAEKLDAEAAELTAQADKTSAQIDAAEINHPLPDPIDVAALEAQIREARTINLNVKQVANRAALLKHAEEKEAESKALTVAMKARDDAKLKAIKEAKMPVDGIGFGDKKLLFNGAPFDQASDADRIRVSVKLAMASNPKLRVLRIKEGVFLDEDSMAIVQAMAIENDYQVWIETIQATQANAVIIEDGRVKE